MLSLSRTASVATLIALLAGPLGALPAYAQAPAVAPATATISGKVSDPGGAPVAGAHVALRGPATGTTTTDATGHFSFSVAPGLYEITVTATGFLQAVDEDVALVPGGVNVSIGLTRPTFTSLRTIGSTRVSGGGGGGPVFNTTPASQSIVGQQTFENQGSLQVRDILDQTPGIVSSISNGSANGGVPGSITFPQIRGGLSYETATLIDGHPLSVGEYGDYVTTFISRFLFSTIELEKGPGSVTPILSRAINGTVNFRTWDPTPTLTGNAEFGVDSYGGKYGNIRIADTVANGKLGFVFDYASYGTPGPGGNDDPQSFAPYNLLDDGVLTVTDSHGNPIALTTPGTIKGSTVGAYNTTVGYTGNVLGCCVDVPTWFENRAFLGKMRYSFSNATSLTLTSISTQTTSSQNGNTNDMLDYDFTPTLPGIIPAGTRQAFNPYNDLFGGDYEINSEPMFEGELRTTVGQDNVLFRAYNAVINRIQTNGDPSGTAITMPMYLYGQTTNGQVLDGRDPYGNPYIATISDPTYQSNEFDNLTGYSFEYDHLLGTSGNVLTLSLDENYSQTHVYEPGTPDIDYGSGDIPSGSAQNTGTLLLRGNFQLTPKLSLVAGYYLTRLSSNFATWHGSSAPYTIDFNDQINWHSDERAAFAYRLDPDTSLRLAAGSGIVPAYLGILNGSAGGSATACGVASIPPPPAAQVPAKQCPNGEGTGYYNTQGGGLNIHPETSFGYDFGADHRIGATTVLTGDIYMTNLFNQFLKAYYTNGIFDGPAGPLPLYTQAYSNLGISRYEGIELGVTNTPLQGFGYVAQGSLIHDAPIAVSAYEASQNPFLVQGQNFGPDTLASNTRMPYAQGYGELNYRNHGFFASFGAMYIGSNNSYNEPAFTVFSSTIRVPIIRDASHPDGTNDTYLQWSVHNISNVDSQFFDLGYEGIGYAGNGTTPYYYATNLKGYGPRSFTLSISHNFR
ncbi:MAG TPA: TonB-dependent receptor [Candidatus Sulfotelmatobacter sp.]|nr:TonB-dependent receptor [Candidatus Sulfotelmatobacter sp.]